MASLSLADYTDRAGLADRQSGCPNTPKRDRKRRRVAYLPVPAPVSLDSEPVQGRPHRKMDLRVTIPVASWICSRIQHRGTMASVGSGSAAPGAGSAHWRINDTPRDLADIGIVGLADQSGHSPLADRADKPALSCAFAARRRARAPTLCNYPTKGHLFDFPTHEPSWPSLMAPHATDEFLGPLFRELGQMGFAGSAGPMGSAGSMGPMDPIGPWDCCEDPGKYSRKEPVTFEPSATTVSAAVTTRMETSPGFLFCEESH
ncbi:MAG: hypothetical protein EBZ77_01355 [Chitinophagia bacterium]|nr:hypothetical protein [Chitinophagia bacterium]